MGGRGSASGINGGKEIRGNVSFSEIVKASPNSISFNKTVTVLPDGKMPYSGRKGDLESLVNKSGINDVVVNMYRDRSGANDIKRMESIGFKIVAQYKGKSSGSVPARDYYYMKRKPRKRK